tara:strand:- start:700 stop:1488 length:789 start_codon:yes stop_codon:yes gene_type:complete
MPEINTNPFPEFDENEWGYIAHLEFANEIWEAAQEEDVSAVLVAAVAQQESAWLPDVMYGARDSEEGAMGVMQIMPETLEDIEKRLGVRIDPYNPKENIKAGTNELRHLSNNFSSDLGLVLVGYNAGFGRAQRYGTDLPEWLGETKTYLREVPKHMHNLFTSGYQPEIPSIPTHPAGQGESRDLNRFQESQTGFQPIEQTIGDPQPITYPEQNWDDRSLFDKFKQVIKSGGRLSERQEKYQQGIQSGLMHAGKIKATGKWRT